MNKFIITSFTKKHEPVVNDQIMRDTLKPVIKEIELTLVSYGEIDIDALDAAFNQSAKVQVSIIK